jgi:hypothetical protein
MQTKHAKIAQCESGRYNLANRRIQLLCHLSAVWFQQLTTLPAIFWWPNGGLTDEKGSKTAAWTSRQYGVLKFQFQLLAILFGLSQFFDPRLYLLHRFKHGTIDDLNIAFPGNVRFRVAQKGDRAVTREAYAAEIAQTRQERPNLRFVVYDHSFEGDRAWFRFTPRVRQSHDFYFA